MTVEVHISRSVLATVVGRVVQQQLRTACFPPVGSYYVDRLDAVLDAIEFTQLANGVEVRVTVEVFVTSRDDVFTAPNAAPVTSSGRGALLLHMTAEGTTTSLRVVDADLGPIPQLDANQLIPAIVAGASRSLELDFRDTLTLINLPRSAQSTVELTAETIAIRFGPAHPVRPRLHPGQDWGVYLDEPAVRAFATARLPNLTSIIDQITTFLPTAHWRPEGARPRIDVEFQGKADVPDPFAGDFDGAFRLRLGLAPTMRPQLRVDLDWELHIDFGDLAPAFLSQVAEIFALAMINSQIDDQDRGRFHAVRTGLWSFQQDIPLPTIEFGPQVAGIGTRFEWKSALATADGMTLGGPVRPLSDPGTMTLQTAATPFGKPSGIVFSSQHGCVLGWQGEQPADLMVIASVGIAGCGSVCRYEVLPPNTGLDLHIEVEATAPESQTLRMRLPAEVAQDVTEPVQLILHTSRGIRLLDLSVPPSGDEAEVAYIDDCLYTDTYVTALLAYEEWWALWGQFPEVWPLIGGPPPYPIPPNPLNDPAQNTTLPGLYVKVITVDEWEPGELVQVRTGTCSVDVTTDQLGRATIPIILPGADRAQPISLTRINRGDTTTATARTAIFLRYATLPSGVLGNTIVTDDTGTTTVTIDFEDGSDLYELVRGKSPQQVATRTNKTAPPPKPQPPLEIDLPGLTDIVPVPGFADAPVVIAVMDDGTQLVLNRALDGSARVAGTFNGLLPRFEVAQDWALAPSANGQLSIFRRSRD